MFIHAVPDNKGRKGGYYCSLVESHRINGVSRHTTILSFGHISAERLPFLKATFNAGNPDEILAGAKRSQEKKRVGAEPEKNVMEKIQLEFIAKITLPDGKIIERVVNADEGIPTPDEFDTSSKERFLESFDSLEKRTLEARNKIAADITEAYLQEVSKKNS